MGNGRSMSGDPIGGGALHKAHWKRLQGLPHHRPRRRNSWPSNHWESPPWGIHRLRTHNLKVKSKSQFLFKLHSNSIHLSNSTGKFSVRSATERGRSAVEFKTEMRRRLVEQGYRIWGNVGDQWSDLQGQFVGNRTFKLPNPMYFVP